jgi:hypothetical protein
MSISVSCSYNGLSLFLSFFSISRGLWSRGNGRLRLSVCICLADELRLAGSRFVVMLQILTSFTLKVHFGGHARARADLPKIGFQQGARVPSSSFRYCTWYLVCGTVVGSWGILYGAQGVQEYFVCRASTHFLHCKSLVLHRRLPWLLIASSLLRSATAVSYMFQCIG